MSLMTPEQRDLYQRLREFDIDGDSPALSFTLRLARENGWRPAYAGRVVDEYKKFLLLAATSEHPVTPSDQVDQAWHLHLSYTDSYWNRLCGEVLGTDLHHNPTRGGESESNKFDAWYERTKALYERTFGAPPPADIWPPAEIRFGDDLHFVRINTRRANIRPRPGPVGTILFAGLWLALAGTLASAAIAVFTGGGAWGDVFLGCLIAAAALFLVRLIHMAMTSTRAVGGDGGCGGGAMFWAAGADDADGGGGSGGDGCGGGGGCGGCGG